MPNTQIELTEQSDLLAFLRKRLKEPLPGHDAQLRMAPPNRRKDNMHRIEDKDCREAGVLILLTTVDRQTSLVLTIRHGKLNNHAGQISFPGGRCEVGETYLQTALRESYEEIGVLPSTLIVAGPLTPLFIPPSNFCVHPYVAVRVNEHPWQIDESEVDSVLIVSLSDLLNINNVIMVDKTIRELKVPVPAYVIGEHEIWGATAMMISELMDVLGEFPIPGS